MSFLFTSTTFSSYLSKCDEKTFSNCFWSMINNVTLSPSSGENINLLMEGNVYIENNSTLFINGTSLDDLITIHSPSGPPGNPGPPGEPGGSSVAGSCYCEGSVNVAPNGVWTTITFVNVNRIGSFTNSSVFSVTSNTIFIASLSMTWRLTAAWSKNEFAFATGFVGVRIMLDPPDANFILATNVGPIFQTLTGASASVVVDPSYIVPGSGVVVQIFQSSGVSTNPDTMFFTVEELQSS